MRIRVRVPGTAPTRPDGGGAVSVVMNDNATTTCEMFEVTVPTGFWDDHEDRDLTVHPVEVIARTRATVSLRLSGADIAELHSDAKHYVASAAHFTSGVGRLVRQAAVAVATIDELFAAELDGFYEELRSQP